MDLTCTFIPALSEGGDAPPTSEAIVTAAQLTQAVADHNLNAMRLQARVAEFCAANQIAGSAIPRVVARCQTPAVSSAPKTPAERMTALQAQRAARQHTEAALSLVTAGTTLAVTLQAALDELPTLEAIDGWMAEIQAKLATVPGEQGSLFAS